MNPHDRGEHVEATALTITAGAASVAILDFAHRIKPLRWGFTVTTAVVIAVTSRVDAVITLFKVDHDRSTQTSLDVLTLDTARAVGVVLYNDLAASGGNDPIEQGEALELDHTTAASGTGPSAAGAGKLWIQYAILGPIWSSTWHVSF